jgi:hypothetical protein
MGEPPKSPPDLAQGVAASDIAEGGVLPGCVGDEAVIGEER